MIIYDEHENFLCFDVDQNKVVKLKNIEVKEEMRGQGHGTALMQTLLKIHNNDTIEAVVPQYVTKDITYDTFKKLCIFFQKFGFTSIIGKSYTSNTAINRKLIYVLDPEKEKMVEEGVLKELWNANEDKYISEKERC